MRRGFYTNYYKIEYHNLLNDNMTTLFLSILFLLTISLNRFTFGSNNRKSTNVFSSVEEAQNVVDTLISGYIIYIYIYIYILTTFCNNFTTELTN